MHKNPFHKYIGVGLKNKIFPRNYFSEVFSTFVIVDGTPLPRQATCKKTCYERFRQKQFTRGLPTHFHVGLFRLPDFVCHPSDRFHLPADLCPGRYFQHQSAQLCTLLLLRADYCFGYHPLPGVLWNRHGHANWCGRLARHALSQIWTSCFTRCFTGSAGFCRCSLFG